MRSGVSGLIFLFRTTSTHEGPEVAAAASPDAGARGAAADASGDEEEGTVEGPDDLVFFLDLSAPSLGPEPPTCDAEATGVLNATGEEAEVVFFFLFPSFVFSYKEHGDRVYKCW